MLDPDNCPVGTVLKFLQDRFSAGLSLSTAIAGHAESSRVPKWDLVIVLEGLSLAPFIPIEEVPEKYFVS